MKKKAFRFVLGNALFVLVGCAGFKSKRVDLQESDERAAGITDEWINKDTEMAVEKIYSQIKGHPNYSGMVHKGKRPKIFVANIQNQTSEPYFPVRDMTDELLQKISDDAQFLLVDADSRNRIAAELAYQHDGMVDPTTAKQKAKQVGADYMIFGAVYMRPQSRKGRTIKEYSLNIRVTDIQRGLEMIRTRTKSAKYSVKNKIGW